ncbi:MAG: flagellar basal-body MS-ring/collar protein FliF [Oscillospiraceae bacterium]|nr:flagellar basal-body MS-ring/collar protein FliF [Oscillospiraceae bacterium]
MEQIKKVFSNIKGYWDALAPARRKLILIVAGAILALAIGVTLFLNFGASGYVVLYENMAGTESTEVYNALQELGIASRMNNGVVQVTRADKDRAIAQLAMQNIPQTTLPYDIFTGSGGLTTTDFEKRQLLVQQLQNRLQDTIRQYSGIKNAYVTLSIAEDSNRVWETSSARSTGSVSVVLETGKTLSRDQVSGIKYLVASSVGSTMTADDVKVIDAATSISLKSREDGDSTGLETGLERLGFEEQIETRLTEKALNVLTIAYDPSDIRISATVVLDYNKMITESKMYQPSDESTNNSGVLQHQDTAYVTDGAGATGGIVGEENNTDTPVYVDEDGDGVMDYINYNSSQDYAVSYIMQQIEKDQAELTSATMAITVKGEIDELTRTSIIENISKATNIDEENISVQNFIVGGAETPASSPNVFSNPVILIGLGASILLLIIIIVVVMLLSKKKKKKQEATMAAQIEQAKQDAESANRSLQQEMEDRKRLIQESANRAKQENAITDEIRDFARDNPEITASILRTWLKEEEH